MLKETLKGFRVPIQKRIKNLESVVAKWQTLGDHPLPILKIGSPIEG